LQNWRFIAVRTPEAKVRLRPIAFFSTLLPSGFTATPHAPSARHPPRAIP
jgi:hypothetical protein